jgi:histone H3/H4
MSMVYNSKMKEAIKAGGCNTAGDAAGALNAAVEAVARCGSNGRKTIRSHDIGSGSSDSGMVVASRVKEAFKAHGCNTGGDAMGAMNALAESAVSDAVSRAQANGRKTVRASDF